MKDEKVHFGISGSDIRIVGNSLLKRSNNIERFKKQIEKQSNFRECFYFKTPKILNYSFEAEYLLCEMEYVQGLDCVSFFYLSDKPTIDNFCNNIIKFIENNIENSKNEFIDKDIFFKKINSININNRLKNDIVCYLSNIKNDSFLIPIGHYHGDLTFTNMIFQTENIYLIDFLNCFVDTPLQDIVKIRQETNFFWSILEHKSKYNFEFNYNKICISYSYIDEKINQWFSKYLWYNKYYNLMQIFNLARILPYNKDPTIEQKIISSIYELINKT
jgi:hypothetical protein